MLCFKQMFQLPYLLVIEVFCNFPFLDIYHSRNFLISLLLIIEAFVRSYFFHYLGANHLMSRGGLGFYIRFFCNLRQMFPCFVQSFDFFSHFHVILFTTHHNPPPPSHPGCQKVGSLFKTYLAISYFLIYLFIL